MTIQDFIKQGHKWIELNGVPVRDSHSKSIVFIHNHFFEGKELEFQNELISNFMKLCPDKEWSWRVYGGETPDADMVGWIYTQTAEIVSGDESDLLPESPKKITEAEDVKEAEGIKVGDKVRHNLTGDRVATVTGIRRVQGYKWEGEITVYRLDFGESVKGPCGMEMNGGEFLREAFTLQEAPEIKPKATDSELESLTAKYAKQIEESALLGCGCMVGDGDEIRKDSKCVKVRTAYKNDSHDPKDWTYCVSWYEKTPIKGDADGQHQTLRECENGILLEQAARHMAYFELMARKGWTLDEILYGEAA